MMKKGELPIVLSRNQIVRTKTKALRTGAWHKVLTRIERVCIDLVINVVERVRSRLLTGVLSSVLDKLEEAMESYVRRLMCDMGSKLASYLSRIVQQWGHKNAKNHRNYDFTFRFTSTWTCILNSYLLNSVWLECAKLRVRVEKVGEVRSQR